MKRASLTGWLNVNNSSNSDPKLKESSIPKVPILNHKKRPSSSISSQGAAGGKGSGRSFAETHSTTLATNPGVSITDM